MDTGAGHVDVVLIVGVRHTHICALLVQSVALRVVHLEAHPELFAPILGLPDFDDGGGEPGPIGLTAIQDIALLQPHPPLKVLGVCVYGRQIHRIRHDILIRGFTIVEEPHRHNIVVDLLQDGTGPGGLFNRTVVFDGVEQIAWLEGLQEWVVLGLGVVQPGVGLQVDLVVGLEVVGLDVEHHRHELGELLVSGGERQEQQVQLHAQL